ncbi:NERD domain-containing protein [Paraclostridium sordellii]|uniref:NERD domain-containing protein n=1 Tax=Paraclostridium sordellii TaxID=1505 RepID=UPI001C61133A|nr:NERD domain-containing protein [Paeniclostridium sordellii]QYE99107.1 NERD domain-containing protein [Paeniclostridium sordellii]
MAIMYPSNIESYNYTDSEKFFYNELKTKLSDDFSVFYSIRWFRNIKGEKETSECDFLIFHPNYGYITIEVKGGVRIEVQEDEWRILDSLSSDSYRILRRSPFKQAEESMYYFRDYYEENFAGFYKGTYGFAVALPFYNIKEDIGISYPKFLIIDKDSLGNLEERIFEIFRYWRGKYRNYLPFSYEQQVKFLKLLNKRISLSAAAGALIEIRQKELDKVNRVQDNYIEFISNYNKAFIIGGAGTGKTWIGIKKATKDFKKGKKVLIITPGKKLADYIKEQIEYINVEVRYFNELYNLEKGSYDTVIVDEGQDFDENQAEYIVDLLKDKNNSTLYVMHDENQKIYDVNFKDKFNISYPPFVLNENIRNTSAIHNWCIKETGIGTEIKPSIVEGVEPEVFKVTDIRYVVNKIENILNELIIKESISNKSIVVLGDEEIYKYIIDNHSTIGRYNIVKQNEVMEKDTVYFNVDIEYKGLESDVIIYIHTIKNKDIRKYIGYSRSRFYLYIINY